MEILQMVVPHTSTEDLATFLTHLTTYLSPVSCPSRILMKRAYRLLELICSGTTNSTREYVSTNLDSILVIIHGLNNSIEATPPVLKTTPTNIPADAITNQLASLSFIGARKSGRKKAQGRIPWKPRLRCLYHLLCHLVSQEQSTQTDSAFHSSRLRNFANMFLPEILAAVCEVNRIVRDLAGRLLVNLVMAFAGQTPASASALPGSSSTAAVLDTKTVRSLGCTNDSDDSDMETRSQAASLFGGFTCTDEDEIRSTISMPRGGPQSLQVCQALNLVISRLWGCLPPHMPVASNSSELSTQESASRVVCHLLQHLKFRRALAFSLGSDCPLSSKIASGILSEALLAAKHLSSSPHRALTRAGLQLIRLLLAFVGLGAVGLTDLAKDPVGV
ncbi:unnamed protein product [Echinostoma caproni]|uniref:DUF4042 domain-containing protein n=1 Tax=Echinostoma caproni TaxID=27848 RepID=A0A183AY13_9TREM|nr:unnamed protein product [Echinostoma caproni]